MLPGEDRYAVEKLRRQFPNLQTSHQLKKGFRKRGSNEPRSLQTDSLSRASAIFNIVFTAVSPGDEAPPISRAEPRVPMPEI